jgi:hypothetical protein
MMCVRVAAAQGVAASRSVKSAGSWAFTVVAIAFLQPAVRNGILPPETGAPNGPQRRQLTAPDGFRRAGGASAAGGDSGLRSGGT